MKKILSMLLAAVMLLSMAACGTTAAKPTDAPAASGEFKWNGQKEVWSILPVTTAEGLVWINDTMGAIMQAEGFTYVKKDAQGNPSNQVTFVEDAIAAKNVGALMIAAMDVVWLPNSKGNRHYG